MTETGLQFDVRKDDLSTFRWTQIELAPLKDGEARLKIGTSALTANNITYGLTGEQFGYWTYFPVADEGWGCLPVWGFADVMESKAEGLAVGERIYGYYPMASHLTVTPTSLKPNSFLDGAEHRAGLPVVYNSYDRVSVDLTYKPEQEAYRTLFVPLAATAYGLADWLQQTDYQGAENVVCLSASSKTALSTAIMMKAAKIDRHTIGLTSARNKELVESLGLYDEVLTYDEITQLDQTKPHVLIDFAGNGEVTAKVHRHLGDQMRYTAGVGASHSEAPRKVEGMIKERTNVFFMPSYAAQRIKETDGQFYKDMRAAAITVTAEAANWMQLDIATTQEGIETLYENVRTGNISPDQGGIIEFEKVTA